MTIVVLSLHPFSAIAINSTEYDVRSSDVFSKV